jgi:hypothetical protein
VKELGVPLVITRGMEAFLLDLEVEMDPEVEMDLVVEMITDTKPTPGFRVSGGSRL